jgi:tetratricopeptide (TPR) repeat protein
MRALAPTLLLLLGTPALGEAPPAAPAPASGAQPAAPPAGAAVVPSAALIEKLGHGDRLFLAGDYRNALFTYQDAVYLQPSYVPARVKLGRAYLALRYAPQAVAQAEAALATDPENRDARKLLEDANAPAAGVVAPAPDPRATPAVVVGGAPQTAAAVPAAPRLFPFTPESDSAAAPARVAAAAEPAANEIAAQHYRTAIGQLEKREWAKAAAELSSAISADPKLAVAHAARGSAHFGLGKYRDAAADYDAALGLDPALATPLYGLAECYRMLGDADRAAEMYDRYALSSGSDVREDLRTLAAKRAKQLR